MKHRLLSIAVLLGLTGQVNAQDFDLTDLTPARPGESVAAGDTVSAGNVVVGNDEATAVKVAHQQLVNNDEDGIRLIQVGSGTGILSIGSAFYETYDNLNATLLSKRAAYNQAALIAKKQLAENFEGVELQCENVAKLSIDYIDTGSDSVGNEAASMQESCMNSVAGSVSGYVTYDVFDDVDANQVRISFISTPKTRAQIRDKHGAVEVTTNPNEIFRQVVNDINNGVLPPMGAKVLTNADTGEVTVLGYGSAIVRHNDDSRMAKRLKQMAKNQSQTRARAALLGTLEGDEVYWQGGFDESQMESTQQFEYTDPERDPSKVKKLDDSRSQFLNQVRQSDAYSAVTQGKLPQGIGMRSFLSEDGHWQYTVAVYSPSLEATAKEAKREMNSGGKATPGNSGEAINAYGGRNSEATNPQGASGAVSDDDNL